MFVRQRGRWLAGFIAAAVVLALLQGQAQGYIFFFKDGFTLQGKVRQAYTFIVDKKAAKAFSVPLAGSPYSIETPERIILFPPQQLRDVVDEKPGPQPMMIQHAHPGFKRTDMPQMWKYLGIGQWDERWERPIALFTTRGNFPEKQRLVTLTPDYFITAMVGHSNDSFYRTGELDPPTLRKLLQIKFDKMRYEPPVATEPPAKEKGTGGKTAGSKDKGKETYKEGSTVPDKGKETYKEGSTVPDKGKEAGKTPGKEKDKGKVQKPAPVKAKARPYTKAEKAYMIATFLRQAGYSQMAYDDLIQLQSTTMELKDVIARDLKSLKKTLALEFIADLELAKKVGRHAEVQERVERFVKENLADVLKDEKYSLQVYEMKSDLEKFNDQIKQARRLLLALPQKLTTKERPFFLQASVDILRELNLDTVGRLETFLDQSRAYELDIQQKRKPNQTPKELLSLALSGWLLGSAAAEGEAATAMKLWEDRLFLVNYLKTDDPATRANLRKEFARKSKLGLDVFTRVARLLPPPEPYPKTGTDVYEVLAQLPGGGPGPTYYVQLPPEYNHMRPYPVLIVAQNVGESAKTALERWSKLGAKNGFILMAPAWVGPTQTSYNYTIEEHQLVLSCLRDLRWRFQVNSDRVFLTGHAEGGLMTYDIGMSHPDLFAGILPMAAWPDHYASYYWSNVQLLPIYTVDGQRHGSSPELNEKMFKEWIRYKYPVLYVSYKGRNREFFAGELPDMMDWMSRKVRMFPLKELGSIANANNKGEEFRIMRSTDNRFYWISTGSLQPPYPNKPPAELSATIFRQNEIHVHARGVNEVSLWVYPGMIDFAKKVKVVVNRNVIIGPFDLQPNPAIMLEDLYMYGDRQRMFLARIDIGLKK